MEGERVATTGATTSSPTFFFQLGGGGKKKKKEKEKGKEINGMENQYFAFALDFSAANVESPEKKRKRGRGGKKG